MLIICEGTDLVGKSTVVDYLTTQLEALKYKAVDTNITKETIKNQCLNQYNRCRAELLTLKGLVHHNKDKFIVCDRSFFTEIVYGRVMRQKEWDQIKVDFLLKTLSDIPHVAIFLKASDRELTKRWKERGDLVIDIKDIKLVQRGYGDIIDYAFDEIPGLNIVERSVFKQKDLQFIARKIKQVKEEKYDFNN